MRKPDLPTPLKEACLEETVADALAAGEDITAAHFFGEMLPPMAGQICEFSGCYFEKCIFSPCHAARLVFVDCVFERCDLNGMDFQKSTFQRVSFHNCRMNGAGFSHATLMNVSFDQCQMDYCSLSGAKAQHAVFSGCTMKETGFADFSWRAVVFDHCCLQASEWLHTSMKGLSLISNEIEGIVVDLSALRGLRVTADQALLLAGLLGLEIVSTQENSQTLQNE